MNCSVAEIKLRRIYVSEMSLLVFLRWMWWIWGRKERRERIVRILLEFRTELRDLIWVIW